MNLKVYSPSSHLQERRYAVDVVVGRFMGLSYAFISERRANWKITLEEERKELLLPDSFLGGAAADWLCPASLPESPLPTWKAAEFLPEVDLMKPFVPVVAGNQGQRNSWYDDTSETSACLGLDVFGSAFFMLTRYEELVLPDRDEHDRFPARASLAYKEGFLDRPIIDEYVEILRAAMKRLWPRLEDEASEGKVFVTCDVDVPYARTSRSFKHLLRTSAGDVVKRKNPRLALRRTRNAWRARRYGDHSVDPNNTFHWMMDTCERHGHRMAFYFIAGHSGGEIDGSGYTFQEPFIQGLLKDIDDRDHEIGMHGSYNTFRDGDQLALERQNLITACEQVGAQAEVTGNRQHYLRWDSSITPDLLAQAGFEYDTTGGYADYAGFRFGTSRSFPMWSWQQNQPLSLQQRPLIVMECSVIAERYMGLGYGDEAWEVMQRLRKRALQYGGTFVLLWHNSHLSGENDRVLFKRILAR